MSKHSELGKKGEKIAEEYLLKKEYKILHKNWQDRHKELDIVAEKDNFLIVVEVKSRTQDYFELPSDAVTRKKQRLIIKATNTYIEKYNIDLEVRFDIISILFSNKSYKIEHIEDAFYPIVK